MRVLRKAVITLLVALFAAAPLQLRAQNDDWQTPANFGTTEWAVANWDKAVDYVKYIAEGNDQEKLKSVPDNLRAEAWQEFWKDSDPVSSTDVNEFRKEYFRRIGYANEHFTTPLRKGWITDRGEAYVRLGEPQYIERFTMRRSGRDIHSMGISHGPRSRAGFCRPHGSGELLSRQSYRDDR